MPQGGVDGSPDRAGVVLGSSEASLPLHCPQDAIRDVHVKGLMYQWITRDMGKGAGPCCGGRGQCRAGPHRSLLPPPPPMYFPEKYILRGDETFAVLSRLVAHGKQLFLITNSPFSFV